MLHTLLYLGVPLVVKSAFPRRGLTDVFVILALWLPIELGWITLWFVPLLGAFEAVLIYEYIWPIPQPWKLGWRWTLHTGDFFTAFTGLLCLCAVLLPLSLALHFTQWSPDGLPPSPRILMIFLFALVEEILFRGGIQNLLEKHLGNARAALILTSVVFGLSHINNTTAFAGPPNGNYVLLAFLAGLGYGLVWLRTRSVVASTLTHFGVNLIWKTFFL
ncbi:CPBP family intramembrane metalloprotease [bacterium]|nr:CPBP family intramembrane metalloprotease [bacterium]